MDGDGTNAEGHISLMPISREAACLKRTVQQANIQKEARLLFGRQKGRDGEAFTSPQLMDSLKLRTILNSKG
jgi:hypothetical protein